MKPSTQTCALKSYTSVEQVAVVEAGYKQGALLAKIDEESAYHLVPIHTHTPTVRISFTLMCS